MKSTKKALLMSCISMLLCVSMLIGSSFAWFTDTASSTNNIIKSGNLDMEIQYYDGNSWETVTESTNLFKNDLWEPGYTRVLKLRVHNAGSLAFKYQFGINVVSETSATNVEGETFLLSDYLECAIVEGDTNYSNREAAQLAISSGAKLNGYSKEGQLTSGASQIITVIVCMPDSVGNVANHDGTAPEIQLGINAIATQLNYEEDSFNKDYDANAPYPFAPAPVEGTVTGEVDADADTTLSSDDGSVTVDIPANTLESDKIIKVDIQPDESAADTSSVTYNINVTDGAGTDVTLNNPITVTMDIGTGLTNVVVTHNPGLEGEKEFTSVSSGTELQNEQFSYNIETGELKICSNSFSPYEIEYALAAYVASIGNDRYYSLEAALEAANANDTITMGVGVYDFEGKTILIDKAVTIEGSGKLATELKNMTFNVDGSTETAQMHFTLDNLKITGASRTVIGQRTHQSRETYPDKLYLSAVTIKNCYIKNTITSRLTDQDNGQFLLLHTDYRTRFDITLTGNTMINACAGTYSPWWGKSVMGGSGANVQTLTVTGNVFGDAENPCEGWALWFGRRASNAKVEVSGNTVYGTVKTHNGLGGVKDQADEVANFQILRMYQSGYTGANAVLPGLTVQVKNNAINCTVTEGANVVAAVVEGSIQGTGITVEGSGNTLNGAEVDISDLSNKTEE